MVMQLSTDGQCLEFDFVSVVQDRLTPPIIHISWWQVIQGFMVSLMVVVLDELLNLVFQLTR